MEILGYVGITIIAIICLILFYIVYSIKNGVESVIGKIERTSWSGIIEAIIEVVEQKMKEKEIREIPRHQELKRKEITKKKIKTFYYLDNPQIEYLLPQVTEEVLQLKRIETNSSKEKSLSANLPLKGIDAGVGMGKNSSTKEIFEAEEKGVVRMYQKIEEHLFNDNELKFGLEDIPKKKIEYGIEQFKEKCRELERFDFIIDDEEQNNHIKKYMKKNAERQIDRISRVTGFVAIQINAKLIDINEEIYELTYEHPVNKYLYGESKGLTLKLLCPKSNITPNGLTTFKKERFFNITAIGKITSWNESDKTLEITPIVIY